MPKPLLLVLALLAAARLTDAPAQAPAPDDPARALALIRSWVGGGYDNRAQAAADVAAQIPDALKHRAMFQIFVPVDMPNIPGYTVYQQASVDGSTDPDRIWRNGVLQFIPDPASGSVRQRELNFRQPARYFNAHLLPGSLTELDLAEFRWDPGCDFQLRAAPDGSEVRGPIGHCQTEMGGQVLTADDEVVILPDQYWFRGRYLNAEGRVVWGNANDEPVRLVRTETLQTVLKPDGGVLIFGGTRNTGLELARRLRARGDPVTVFVRPAADRSALEPLDVRFVVGDALDPVAVSTAVHSARYRAIVSTLGCSGCDSPPDYLGNRNVFDAASAAGVRRVILVSTIGAGDSKAAVPWIARWYLGDVISLKTSAEEHLRSLDLDYTILRPGGLKSAPATGRGELTGDIVAMGMITRADLAALIVRCLDDPATAGQTFTARDPELDWPWDMLF